MNVTALVEKLRKLDSGLEVWAVGYDNEGPDNIGVVEKVSLEEGCCCEEADVVMLTFRCE